MERLIQAIRTDLDWVRTHTEWGLKAREWDRGERDPSFLLSSKELELAERWRSGAAGKEPGVSRLQNEYIDTSRQAATQRLRRTRGFVSGALVVAIGLAVLALILRQQAVSEKQSATSGEPSTRATRRRSPRSSTSPGPSRRSWASTEARPTPPGPASPTSTST